MNRLDSILKNTADIQGIRPKIKCKDGFSMSVQDSSYHYATTGVSAEIGFPSEKELLIMSYAEDPGNPTKTVYPNVPLGVITAIIEKHGGLKKS